TRCGARCRGGQGGRCQQRDRGEPRGARAALVERVHQGGDEEHPLGDGGQEVSDRESDEHPVHQCRLAHQWNLTEQPRRDVRGPRRAMMTVVVTGYGGTFRATVVTDADPMQQWRLQVVVPEVYGDSVPVWAVASRSDESNSPAIGDLVWVSFEHGGSDYPVWQGGQGAGERGRAPRGARG